MVLITNTLAGEAGSVFRQTDSCRLISCNESNFTQLLLRGGGNGIAEFNCEPQLLLTALRKQMILWDDKENPFIFSVTKFT